VNGTHALTDPTVYIEVAVTLPLDQTYTYSVPDNLLASVAIGKRVWVPFGRRRVTGFILSRMSRTDVEDIRPILDIIDDAPLFPAALIPFYRWIADYYHHPIGRVVKSALPGGLNLYEITHVEITPPGLEIQAENAADELEIEILTNLRCQPLALKALQRRVTRPIPRSLIERMAKAGWIHLERKRRGGQTRFKTERWVRATDLDPESYEMTFKHAPLKNKLLAYLKDRGEVSVRSLKSAFPTAARHLKALENAGLIAVRRRKVYRDPFGDSIEPSSHLELTAEQSHVTEQVMAKLGQGFAPFLLDGVTGSGKTEVYLQVASQAIAQGHNVMVLVPEIALISQMERRFRARFGDRIAVLHSGLSNGERFDQWQRILNQEVPIVIGTRSAIFAPFAEIGIIIVDEEHDTSYKQEGALCYNARDLAVVRARLHDGVTLLGSATPSIQSHYNTTIHKYVTLQLTKRIEQRPLPDITVVDLRTSRNGKGFQRIISHPLYHALEATLARGDQALLFLNRRGYASYPVCGDCGTAVTCAHCDICLTLHQSAGCYKCHYCGFTRPVLSSCPACGSPRIKNLGLGTEKLENLVQSLFPQARVARMDGDTTARKGALLKLLKGLRQRTIDIMVGTQMVAKGHDFPHITLVGIVCADLALNFPDFRAGERTFQLLAQVSGRAGRGESPGRVILQTYNPEHFSITAAQKQDFLMFYQQELQFRRELRYPPYTRMVQIKISGKNQATTRALAQWLGDTCQNLKRGNPQFSKSIEILGPIEAPLARIAGQFRWQILLKGHPFNVLHHFTHEVTTLKRPPRGRGQTRIAIDVDPFFMM
jgi:primosomal protein N' (replication factor Y)